MVFCVFLHGLLLSLKFIDIYLLTSYRCVSCSGHQRTQCKQQQQSVHAGYSRFQYLAWMCTTILPQNIWHQNLDFSASNFFYWFLIIKSWSNLEFFRFLPRHISPSCCLCILQPGPWVQRTKISLEYQFAIWKGLVDAALRMPLHPFGTLFLHLLNMPLPLITLRAAWRLAYLMCRIPRSIDSYIVWVYCLWLFQCFPLTCAFERSLW